MAKVAIVTDSTADLPEEYVRQYPIRVVPQTLIWGQETFKDRVDIQPGEFYTRLKTTKVMPSTSQASPQAFHQAFSEFLDQGYDVLAIVLSARLSGTYSSAIQAREMLPGARIEIVDTYTASMASGFCVLAAARAAEQGATLAECQKIAEEARQHVKALFCVDTLEFLHRGGRIGGGARLLGSALNIKPILEITGGQVEPLEKVRTRRKSLQRILEIVAERVEGQSPVRLSALHANCPDDALWLLAEASKMFPVEEKLVTEVSPVIGTHVGPGTVGMAYMAGM
jgi:DegV family protein with EDD domain